nr:polysaccharide biosynthesis C-terminal domain-containing protein [Blautia sp. CAG:237]
MQIPDDISGEAYDYMFVVLLGTGATVFYNMISNMLRALGDSKTPLYFLVFSSVLNIFLDILFIVPFHMGVAGAAWATILSQFLSALFSLIVRLKNFPVLLQSPDIRLLPRQIRFQFL